MLILACCIPASAQDYSKMSRYVRERVYRHISSSALPHSTAAAKGSGDGRRYDIATNGTGTATNETATADKNGTGTAKSAASTATNGAKAATTVTDGTDGMGKSGVGERLLVFIECPEDVVRPWCLSHAGGIHIALVPLDSLAKLSEDSRVSRIEANKRRTKTLNDLTQQKTGTDKLQQGFGPLLQAFDGEGILVGVQDVSFDMGHPTFRSKKDGRLRIVRMWDMLDNEPNKLYNDGSDFPIGRLYNTLESLEAKDHSTDAYMHYHGTHVAGIAAGNGCDTPYTGMAPEADIYLASTIINSNDTLLTPEQKESLTDAIYMLAFQNMFNYADSVGMPCVVNFSIGGSYDIADNDPLTERYAEAITGPGKIIVAAAGNEATKRYYLPKPVEKDTVGGLFLPESSAKELALHISATSHMVLRITDVKNTSFNNSHSWGLGFRGGGSYRDGETVNLLPWNNWYEYESTGDLGKGTIVKIFSGQDGFNPDRVGYDIYLTPPDKSFKKNSYVIEIIGQGAEAFAYVQEGVLAEYRSTKFNLDGAEIGASINSPATLPSVLAVGSTSWRTSFVNYKDQIKTVTAGKDGLLSSYSSIGPAPTGCTKPDFCAPGQALISSFNSHFIQKYNPAVDSYIVDLNGTHSDYTGRDYGWLALSGTSMACPVATGIIALWLQADPSLTKERIMEIIAKTSRQPDPALSYPNDHYGYGEIDAYRGMLEVLGMTGIRTISPTPLTTATVRPDGNGNIIITLNGAAPAPAAAATAPTAPAITTTAATVTASNTVPAGLPSGSSSAPTGSTVTVYDTAGHIVRRAAITSTTGTHTPITIPMQDLHGIFVVQVGQQGSTIIRL